MVPMYQTIDLGRCHDLTDDAFVAAFESRTLEAGRFGHVDHVRLAFLYLNRGGLLETLRRYREALKGFAEHHGAPDKYHETVTVALVLLIHERMAGRSGSIDWPTFASENPNLLRWRDGAFFDYYPPDVLESETARCTFVLPAMTPPLGRVGGREPFG